MVRGAVQEVLREVLAMGMLNQVIRTVVISALGAKLAKGRSPIVAALLTLLATRALAKREDASVPSPGNGGGLGGLIDRFRQGDRLTPKGQLPPERDLVGDPRSRLNG